MTAREFGFIGSYLLLISHGALPSHHNLAAGFCLQLFGCQSAGAQDPPYEVELTNTKTHATRRWYTKTHCIGT